MRTNWLTKIQIVKVEENPNSSDQNLESRGSNQTGYMRLEWSGVTVNGGQKIEKHLDPDKKTDKSFNAVSRKVVLQKRKSESDNKC